VTIVFLPEMREFALLADNSSALEGRQSVRYLVTCMLTGSFLSLSLFFAVKNVQNNIRLLSKLTESNGKAEKF